MADDLYPLRRLYGGHRPAEPAAEVLKWLSTLEHGIRAEIERVFNQSMAAPDRWADLGFANLLGRREEAEAHNAPIWAERQRQAKLREAELEARRVSVNKSYKTAIPPPSERRSKHFSRKRSCKSRYQRQVSDHAAFSGAWDFSSSKNTGLDYQYATQYSIFPTEWSMELPLP